jgi:hypothetical protein
MSSAWPGSSSSGVDDGRIALLGRYFSLLPVIGDDLVDRRLADPMGLALLILALAICLRMAATPMPSPCSLRIVSLCCCAVGCRPV